MSKKYKKIGKCHILSIDDANKYGPIEALFLYNIRFWVESNRDLEKESHYHEGHYWTYNTVKSFKHVFGYLSISQIKRVIAKLESDGVLISGTFNRFKYDKTKWYRVATEDELSTIALVNKEHSNIDKTAIPLAENDQPIPNVNTDINTDVNNIPLCEIPNQQKPVSTGSKSIIPENISGEKKEKIKEKKEIVIFSGKGIEEILKEAKDELKEKENDLKYLYDLGKEQIINPGKQKGKTYKGKSLNRIFPDICSLYKILLRKHHPKIGTIVELTGKDKAQLKQVMIRYSGKVEVLERSIKHWETLRTHVKEFKGYELKQTFPDPQALLHSSQAAISDTFQPEDTKTEEEVLNNYAYMV